MWLPSSGGCAQTCLPQLDMSFALQFALWPFSEATIVATRIFE